MHIHGTVAIEAGLCFTVSRTVQRRMWILFPPRQQGRCKAVAPTLPHNRNTSACHVPRTQRIPKECDDVTNLADVSIHDLACCRLEQIPIASHRNVLKVFFFGFFFVFFGGVNKRKTEDRVYHIPRRLLCTLGLAAIPQVDGRQPGILTRRAKNVETPTLLQA